MRVRRWSLEGVIRQPHLQESIRALVGETGTAGRGERCGEQGTPSSASPLSREIRVGSHEKGGKGKKKKKESIFV